MKRVSVVLFLIFAVACVHKNGLTKTELEEKLKTAMRESLYSKAQGKFDTAYLHYDVLDVTYFESKLTYECEFKVHMRNHDFDTTGNMSARISKDFKQVARKL